MANLPFDVEYELRRNIQNLFDGSGLFNGEFLNRQQKKHIERLGESATSGMYNNHNSLLYRKKLKEKLIAKQKK
tara:strand:+ start:268 stop:489 length:222 start_codon:yes stop_codon:yes gene_type:complete